LASAQQELIQQQGYMNHNQPQFVPQPVPAIIHKPTLSLTDGPATEQVLSQMLAKAEAHTPDELCRLLRDRSDKLALAFATSGAISGVFYSLTTNTLGQKHPVRII